MEARCVSGLLGRRYGCCRNPAEPSSGETFRITRTNGLFISRIIGNLSASRAVVRALNDLYIEIDAYLKTDGDISNDERTELIEDLELINQPLARIRFIES